MNDEIPIIYLQTKSIHLDTWNLKDGRKGGG